MGKKQNHLDRSEAAAETARRRGFEGLGLGFLEEKEKMIELGLGLGFRNLGLGNTV